MGPDKEMYIGDMDRWTLWGQYYFYLDLGWVMIILLYRLYVGYNSPNKEDSARCFVKIWIPINETQQCGIGSPT